MAWQIKIGAGSLSSPETLGVEDVALDFVSRAADTCILSGASALLTAEYTNALEVWDGSTRRFAGKVRTVPLQGVLDRSVVAYGPWAELDRVIYCQRWKIWDTETGALIWVYSSRAVLGQSEAGAAQSVGAQISDIVAYAVSRGVAIQLGACSIPLVLPMDEVRDTTCTQAIDRLLRFCPSVCSWIDYATTPPTLHFGQSSALAPSRAEDTQIALRHDLVVPGIRIEIERSGSIDGEAMRSLEFLTAGDADDVDAVWTSMQLSGLTLSQSRVTIDVVTEAIPDPLTNAAWWVARHPRLANIAAADMTFIQADRGLTPEDYPRISLNPLSDLTAIGKKARVEKFHAILDIVQRDAGGVIVASEHAVELELQLVTTDATTRTYSYLESADLDGPEETPAGLAAALLAHWSVLYAEGRATWPIADLWTHPGHLMHATPIQRVTASIKAGNMTATYGPPQHLSASDLAALLARFRTRRASARFRARTSGKTPATATQAKDAVAPVRVGGHATGEVTRLRLAQGTSGSAKTIDLDPSLLAVGETALPRQIDIPSTAGSAARVKAVATASSAVTHALPLLVGSDPAPAADGRTTVTQGTSVGQLSDALRVVTVASAPRLALNIADVYLVDPSTGAQRPISDFLCVVGSGESAVIALRLEYVKGIDMSGDPVVASVPVRQHFGSLYPRGAEPHA